MMTTVPAWHISAPVGLAVCFLVVLLAICFLRSRRRRNNNDPSSIFSSSSSSRLLSNNQQAEQENQQEKEDEEYKQDAWFASMSTPAAYRYMNDPKSKDKIQIPPEASGRIHLIVLVHGWMGRPCSLGYMKDALERQATAAAIAAAGTTTSTGKNSNDTPHFIIHAATANQEQTSDGVAAGGCRLAQEVEEIIQNIKEQWRKKEEAQHSPTSTSSSKSTQQRIIFLSVSFVAHSLGGLYARYAVAKIPSLQKPTTRDDASSKTSDTTTKVIVKPAIFCTTCSPHLGLADELLYLPNVPRWLQYIVAACILKQTGTDLFRFTNLLQEMVLEPSFRNALGSFRQRITYVNTHGTDFQVPTQTAAFLAPDNNLWHRQRQIVAAASSSTAEAAAAAATSKLISLVVETCPRPMQQQQGQQQQQEQDTIAPTNTSQHGSSSSSTNKTRPIMATNAELAAEMDALGWTKVFCDVRDEIQSFPRFCYSRRHCHATPCPPSMATTPLRSMSAISSNSSTNDSSTSVNDTVEVKDERSKLTSLGRGGGGKSLESDDDTPLDDKDNNKYDRAASAENYHYYSSKELLDRFNNNSDSSNEHRWYVPSAHLVMVASTKREFLVERTAAGRPIMDELASRVVQGILQCESKVSE